MGYDRLFPRLTQVVVNNASLFTVPLFVPRELLFHPAEPSRTTGLTSLPYNQVFLFNAVSAASGAEIMWMKRYFRIDGRLIAMATAINKPSPKINARATH